MSLPVEGHVHFSDNIYGRVVEGINEVTSKSDLAFDEANELMDRMARIARDITDIPTITTALGTVESTVQPYLKPAVPVEPDIQPNFPTAPEDPVTGTVGTITLSTAPTFTAAEPGINEIAVPAAFSESLPSAPTLPASYDYPDVPDNTLPVAPSPRELTLPSAPNIITVNFDGTMPASLRTPPSTSFNFTDEAYASDLTNALKTQLLSLVNNARQTGLLPAIEDQIWSRARERTASQEKRLNAAARRQFASLGWNMPQGDEALKLMQAAEEAVELDVTESRSIAIAQADLEQKNLQFSIQAAIGLEGQLITLHNAEQQRLFEAARYTIEAAISLYGLEVSYFNANVSLYETQARVYQARLQAQLTEIEVYKGQLEGQRLVGDINKQDIDIYLAKIEGVRTTHELYKAELEGVKLRLEGDGLKLQQFESSVKAYAEKVRAKSLEYDGYKAQLSGEEIKVTMYEKLASAFRSKIDGFKIETDAKIAKQESDIKIAYDVPLKISEQKTAIYQSMIQAESEKVKSLNALYETRGNVYESQVKGETGRVSAEVEIQKNEIEKLVADANINIEALKANVSTLLAQKEMLIGVQKTIAQVKAQLAASYGSAINYGATMQTGVSYGDTHHTSHSWGVTESL